LRSLSNVDKRGKATKSQILDAALELFGEYGFEATSTRMISEKSQSNVSAIGYHFGGKEGLYGAVLMCIVEGGSDYFDNVFEYSKELSNKKTITKDHAKKLLEVLTESLVKMFIEVEELQYWAKVVSRELMNPSQSFDIVYEKKIKPLYDVYCKMIAVVLGARENNLEVKIMAHCLFGQILSFVVSKESFMRMAGIEKLAPSHVKMIKKILIRNSLCILKK